MRIGRERARICAVIIFGISSAAEASSGGSSAKIHIIARVNLDVCCVILYVYEVGKSAKHHDVEAVWEHRRERYYLHVSVLYIQAGYIGLSLSHRGTSVASYPLKTLAANNIMRRRWPQRRSRDERIREDLISASLCPAMMINLGNKRARPYISAREGKVGQTDDGRHYDFIRQVNNGAMRVHLQIMAARVWTHGDDLFARRINCRGAPIYIKMMHARTGGKQKSDRCYACILRITRVARWPRRCRQSSGKDFNGHNGKFRAAFPQAPATFVIYF